MLVEQLTPGSNGGEGRSEREEDSNKEMTRTVV